MFGREVDRPRITITRKIRRLPGQSGAQDRMSEIDNLLDVHRPDLDGIYFHACG